MLCQHQIIGNNFTNNLSRFYSYNNKKSAIFYSHRFASMVCRNTLFRAMPSLKQTKKFIIVSYNIIMSQDPILYWNIVSQPARAVKALIDIGKIKCKFNNIDLFKLEQKKANYLSINPMGTVPTLVHNNLKITESIAILAYLCQNFKSIPANYYGTNLEERAAINQYLSWCQGYLRPNIGALFLLQKQIGLRMRKPLPGTEVLAAQAKIKQALKTLDSLIGQKNYITNNVPTIADIMIYFQVTILAYHGKDHYSYPNIDRWFKKIYSIPEVKMLTHQWFPVAQQLCRLLSQLPVTKASL